MHKREIGDASLMNNNILPTSKLGSKKLLGTVGFVLWGHKERYKESGNRDSLEDDTLVFLVNIYKGFFKGMYELTDEEQRIRNGEKEQPFTNRGHTAFKKNLENRSYDLEDPSRWLLRSLLYSMFCVIKNLFDDENGDDSIRALKDELAHDRSSSIFKEQKSAAGNLLYQLTRIIEDKRALNGVSFTEEGAPIIHTNKSGFLDAKEARSIAGKIAGQYSVYRQVFTLGGEKKFIKEYLKIQVRRHGAVATMYSRLNTAKEEQTNFNGVLFFSKGQVWFIVNCATSISKTRVGLATIDEWQDYARRVDKGDKTAEMSVILQSLGSKGETRKAVAIGAVLRIQTKNGYENFDNHVRFLEESEIREILTENEQKILDQRIEV